MKKSKQTLATSEDILLLYGRMEYLLAQVLDKLDRIKDINKLSTQEKRLLLKENRLFSRLGSVAYYKMKRETTN